MRLFRFTASALLIFLLTQWIAADIIYLTNGNRIEGEIVNRIDDRVIVRAGGTNFTLRESDILRIEEGNPYNNTLIRARDAFRTNQLMNAIRLLRTASDQGAPGTEVSDILMHFDGTIHRYLSRANDREKREIRRELLDLEERIELSGLVLFNFANYLHRLDDMMNAGRMLDKMGMRTLADDPARREWAMSFFRHQVRFFLERGEFEMALSRIEEMRVYNDGDDTHPQIPLSLLSAAADARDREDFETAINLISTDLAATVPEIARNRAIFTIKQLNMWARDNRQFHQARLYLEPLAEKYPMEYNAAVFNLLKDEARHYLNQNNPQAAEELLMDLEDELIPKELVKLKDEAAFETRRQQTGEDDPIGLLELGEWALERGMYQEALHLLEITRRNPNLVDVSDQLIANAQTEKQVQLLEEAQQLFDKGQLANSIHVISQIKASPVRRSDIISQANRLENIAMASLEAEHRRRPYQAEVFFQEAERAFFQGKHRESFNLLNLIIGEYGETAAARRASQLLPQVLRDLEIASLETGRPPSGAIASEITIEQFQQADKLYEEVRRMMDALRESTGGS